MCKGPIEVSFPYEKMRPNSIENFEGTRWPLSNL